MLRNRWSILRWLGLVVVSSQVGCPCCIYIRVRHFYSDSGFWILDKKHQARISKEYPVRISPSSPQLLHSSRIHYTIKTHRHNLTQIPNPPLIAHNPSSNYPPHDNVRLLLPPQPSLPDPPQNPQHVHLHIKLHLREHHPLSQPHLLLLLHRPPPTLLPPSSETAHHGHQIIIIIIIIPNSKEMVRFPQADPGSGDSDTVL